MVKNLNSLPRIIDPKPPALILGHEIIRNCLGFLTYILSYDKNNVDSICLAYKNFVDGHLTIFDAQ